MVLRHGREWVACPLSEIAEARGGAIAKTSSYALWDMSARSAYYTVPGSCPTSDQKHRFRAQQIGPW